MELLRRVDEIRDDFPFLKLVTNGKRLIYFDNAATTQKPKQVIDALLRVYTETNANVHRGVYRVSEEATEKYENARADVASFIGADQEEIVFTRNTTESINLLAYTMQDTINAGDKVVSTIFEHHSNFLPWRMLAEKKKARFDIVNISEDWKLNEEDFDAKISGAKLLTITHASNVTGTILPIKEIIRKARKEGAIVVVDGAQAAPHLPVNVRDLDADFYAFSAHKMLGPTGLGVLYGKKALLEELPPFLLGGEMIKEVHTDGQMWNDVPWKFEAGTPNYADAIAFTEAIRYLKSIGMDNIHSYEKELMKYLLDQIKAVKDVKVYGPPVEERGAIMPFTVEGIHPHDIAGYLDSMAVAVRSGFHCAQPLQESMGLLDGTARASLYFYNDFEEIDKFVDAIRELVKVFL